METKQLSYVPMYKSYIDAVAKLTPEDRLAIYEAIFEFGFTGVEPTFNNPYLEMGWNLVKPNLMNNIDRVKVNQENGKKGGRPPKKVIETKEVISETIQPEPIETIQPETDDAFAIELLEKFESKSKKMDPNNQELCKAELLEFMKNNTSFLKQLTIQPAIENGTIKTINQIIEQ